MDNFSFKEYWQKYGNFTIAIMIISFLLFLIKENSAPGTISFYIAYILFKLSSYLLLMILSPYIFVAMFCVGLVIVLLGLAFVYFSMMIVTRIPENSLLIFKKTKKEEKS